MIKRGTYLTNRALRWIALEVSGLQRAVYVLALFALLSSFTGLARDRLLAHVFGASTQLDLYYAAFRIPDLLFVGVGAIVSVYILIPELARRNEKERHDYIDTMLAGFSIFAIIVCAIAAAVAPALLTLLFPAFVAQGHLPILAEMTRIMLLQPILLGFSNIFAAITQSKHRYLLYSLSPLLYNLGIIAGTVMLYPIFGIAGLAYGVVFGALMHAGIQVPSLISDGFLKRLPRLYDVRALLESVTISIPRALALSMSEIAELGLIALAGGLAAGSISIFNFAYNLQAVPLSIIGASYSVAAFPGFAASLSAGKREEFLDRVASAASQVVFWSLPATALMIVLRAHIVRVILGSGAFNWNDTRLTAAAFALFGSALAAQGLALVLIRAYYAAGRTFVPFFLSTLTAALTIVLGAAVVGSHQVMFLQSVAAFLLRASDIPGASVLALAFAYAFIAIAGTLALIAHFEHRFRGFLSRVWKAWGQAAVASLACGEAAYLTLQFVGPLTLSSTLISILVHASLSAAAGIAVCTAVYALVGSREFKENAILITGRFRRSPLPPSIVAAAEEHVA